MKTPPTCECCGSLHEEAGATRRTFLGGLGAGIVAAGAASEALLPTRAKAQTGLKSIPVAGLVGAAAHNAALEMANAKGYVAANGLQIAQKEYAAGAFLIQAITAGDIVAGVCGTNPALLGKAQGVDLKILANSNMEGSVLVVGPDVKTPKDLDGRKIGTPGIAAIQDTLLSLYEQKNGIKTQHVPVKVTDMPTLLRNKEIAGYIVWEVTGQAGLALGGGRVLATSSDIRPGHECCALVASGKFLRDDPETALRLVKAFAQGLKHVVANPDDVVEVVAKRDGLDPTVARSALKNVRYKYPPFNDTADLSFVVQALMKAEKIDKSQVRDVDAFVADAVDNRMIRSIAG